MPTLHWLTRDKDLQAASAVPYRLLEEVPSLGAGDPNTGNMLIQGDNLDALKALLPFYAGRVKCIYIDPPYNTRSAFEHHDDSVEHTQVGALWERSTGGKGLFIVAEKLINGKDVRAQLIDRFAS